MTSVQDLGRGDVLSAVFAAGELAERARGLEGMKRLHGLASVSELADLIARVDPVAGQVIREGGNRVLHGEQRDVDGSAGPVSTRALAQTIDVPPRDVAVIEAGVTEIDLTDNSPGGWGPAAPPVGYCTGCHRACWEHTELGSICGMTQPGGARCTGLFAPESASSDSSASDEVAKSEQGPYEKAVRAAAALLNWSVRLVPALPMEPGYIAVTNPIQKIEVRVRIDPGSAAEDGHWMMLVQQDGLLYAMTERA